MKYEYEEDDVTFNAPAYSVGNNGLAYHVLGWQVEKYYDEIEVLDENDIVVNIRIECISKRTGLVVARAIGNCQIQLYAQKVFKPLTGLDFCRDCGQIGCKGYNYE